jgi:hypothetical protein
MVEDLTVADLAGLMAGDLAGILEVRQCVSTELHACNCLLVFRFAVTLAGLIMADLAEIFEVC